MVFLTFISHYVRFIGLCIEYVGLAFVVGSAVIALVKLPLRRYTMEHVRRNFAKRIIFGLEFIIAADILLATVTTNLSELIQLAGIVLIRVVLGYVIRKEAGLK